MDSPHITEKKERTGRESSVVMGVAAISIVGLAAAIIAARKKSQEHEVKIEKNVEMLNSKFEKLTETLKEPQKIQKNDIPIKKVDAANQTDKKEVKAEQKNQDVIYVRKSTEFSFYS